MQRPLIHPNREDIMITRLTVALIYSIIGRGFYAYMALNKMQVGLLRCLTCRGLNPAEEEQKFADLALLG